jgi:hypothetical protein
MNHPNEEQFILYYYGEDPGVPVAEHLSGCEACRAEYRTLQRVLNTVETMPVPERGAEYGATVWNRIQPKLAVSRRTGWRSWFEWRRMALAAAMACLIVGAFIAGRFVKTGSAPVPQTATSAGPVRERILLVAVGDHLDRSQMVLAEFVNNGDSTADQQQAAADLVESNRLYRLTAVRNGDSATAAVLEDLERALLEIAHSPSEVSQQQLSNVLFKVRVYATQVRQRETKEL